MGGASMPAVGSPGEGYWAGQRVHGNQDALPLAAGELGESFAAEIVNARLPQTLVRHSFSARRWVVLPDSATNSP